VTEYGKAIPVDLAPSPDGNLVLVDEGDRVVARVEAAPLPLLDGGAPRSLRFASHFVTCPYADKHRRRVTTRSGRVMEARLMEALRAGGHVTTTVSTRVEEFAVTPELLAEYPYLVPPPVGSKAMERIGGGDGAAEEEA
jgi:hypothetical protein